ncbi:acyl-CoA thioesterase [Falsiroseomonas bella]|uniref:Acyl-CoA thioesterase n=1 Tax=Falsiroseomonas bella TaxID=2184016 RepID=A0A317FH49_9PROT|nr:thioesterase family protein [Falsiroseomonas bella]PWS36958.1 acyl-CoA thioesterase [Falsiroseomonas bella]
MSRPIEGKAYPFIHARRIRWGESDPARIAYTARFLDFAMDAIEAFFTDRLGVSFYEFNVDMGSGSPFVRVELDFRSPVTPRDTLETEVRIARLGGSSVTFVVIGRVGDRVSYEGRLVCAFVDSTGEKMKPIPIPPEFRAKLEADVLPG